MSKKTVALRREIAYDLAEDLRRRLALLAPVIRSSVTASEAEQLVWSLWSMTLLLDDHGAALAGERRVEKPNPTRLR